MEPKIIVMPYGGRDSETSALETAIEMAKAYKGHLDVWHISPDPYEVFMPYGALNGGMAYLPEEAINDFKKANAEVAGEARKKYLKLAAEHGVPDIETPPVMNAVSATFHNATGKAGDIISLRGRVSDLIVMSRTPTEEDGLISETIQSALFQSARPVLLIPPGQTMKKPSNNILIAWNGSAEAAHAVAFALPYMKGKNVRVITQQVKDGDEPDLMPADLAHYLKRHGIDADSGVCWNKDLNLPDCIIDAARYEDVDMIIMGAYSHSRMRELILGGVTEYMLKHADVPVFMAH